MSEAWYCMAFGQDLGPMSLADLKTLVERGDVLASDRIKCGAAGAWQPAGEMAALFPSASCRSPGTTQAGPTAFEEPHEPSSAETLTESERAIDDSSPNESPTGGAPPAALREDHKFLAAASVVLALLGGAAGALSALLWGGGGQAVASASPAVDAQRVAALRQQIEDLTRQRRNLEESARAAPPTAASGVPPAKPADEPSAPNSPAPPADKPAPPADKPAPPAKPAEAPPPSVANPVAAPPSNVTAAFKASPASPPNNPAAPPNSSIGSSSAPSGAGGAEKPRPQPPDSIREVVQTVEPSVVVVEVPGVGLGSGFVVDEQGTIATNYHVIEGAKTATIRFPADKSTFPVLGFTSIAPGKDLAVLKINPGGKLLKPLAMAAAAPEKGESVLAFGAPKGFDSSVSDGIVSSVRNGTEVRDLLMQGTETDIYSEHLGYDLDAVWIQTTAPISGGNSGGPLVNLRGEVVGLNTWNRTDGQNLNFAISIDHLRKLTQSASGSPRPLSELPAPKKQPGGSDLASGDPTAPEGVIVEAGKPARQGAVAVRIKNLGIGKVQLDDLGDAAESVNELFVIWLQIANMSSTEKVDYRGWAVRGQLASLRDEEDNSYSHAVFGLSKVVGQIDAGVSIYPRKTLGDCLVFELPTKTCQTLILELPATAFGGQGSLRMKISRSLWDKKGWKREQVKEARKRAEARKREEARKRKRGSRMREEAEATEK